MYFLKKKYAIISMIKYESYVTKVLRLEGPGTMKSHIINQDYSTNIFIILYWLTIEIETIKMGNSLLQIILLIREKVINDGVMYTRTCYYQRNQCQYFPKKKI